MMKIKVILLTLILLLSFSTVVFAGEDPPPPPPDVGDEWCSPGYWRNHLDSWTEHDVLFSAVIGEVTLSKLGVKRGMTANPTLLQVLQGPQYYGGAAFNAVGDYLSEIYVNFNGVRVPGSCPLN
jgi:hypothetical protein